MSQRTGLPDEAAREGCATLHPRARGDDEVRADDAIADIDGCCLYAIDTPII